MRLPLQTYFLCDAVMYQLNQWPWLAFLLQKISVPTGWARRWWCWRSYPLIAHFYDLFPFRHHYDHRFDWLLISDELLPRRLMVARVYEYRSHVFAYERVFKRCNKSVRPMHHSRGGLQYLVKQKKSIKPYRSCKV